ncbi:FmdB family zinc ribbon protein [Megalodesulfovibrio paquesii]
MPNYDYEHMGQSPSATPCSLGHIFEQFQSIHDEPLAVCPICGAPVRRLISKPMINVPRSDAEIRDAGFTKLVRRDDGVYENVTARDGESRYVHRDKPETMPDLSRVISD